MYLFLFIILFKKQKTLKNLEKAVIRSGKSEIADKFANLKKSLGENRKHLIHIDLKKYCLEIITLKSKTEVLNLK